MKRSQLIVVAVAVVAVVAIAAVGRGSGDKANQNASRGSSPPTGAVKVTVASSPEKFKLVADLANAFNRTGTKVDGKPVFVDARSASSGDEEQAIAHGTDRPIVWSPASTLWARLLDNETDRDLVAAQNPSIVRTPLVLAMWEPLARALGWPKKQIGFADVFRLARDPRGWAALGHPEYGDFKFVHTNPSVSTAGLEVVAAAYLAATGKKEGLTVADVERPDVQRKMTALEQSIVHYGNNTIFIADQLREHGTSYASAVAMEEATLVDFNAHRGDQPKLVAIYPDEGTFVSDDPYLILRAPWVDKDERAGAVEFQRFIAKTVTPQFAAKYGFRSANPTQAPVAPVDAANGVDPEQPSRVLAMPEPAVVAQLQKAWFANRKAANIELVVDTSGSMYDESKLVHAKQGLQQFLGQLSPRDRVGLIAFSDQVRDAVPLQPFSKNARRLRQAIDGLVANGETSLYDATRKAVDDVAQLRDNKRINAVVVLSDGQDTSSSGPLQDMLPALKVHTGPEATPIRVFTIAYGQEPDRTSLDKIAAASDGQAYIGSTGNIGEVYRGISSFF